MRNLNSRINKAKALVGKTAREKEMMFFVRMSPDVMGDSEKRFREENADFEGKIIVFCFGAKNLNQYVPDGNNERS
jgi:hypothetical protein